MTENLRVIVVGAGVFGASAALELRKRRHSVHLIDPGPLPQPKAASTDISKVIRMDYGSDAFYMELMEGALEGWRGWNRRWPEPLYHETGFLLLSSARMGPGGFEHESYQLLKARGHRPEKLDPADLAERFPAWKAERYAEAYFNPDGGWAESGRVVAWLVQACRAEGVRLLEGVKVAGFLEQGSRVTGVKTEAGERVEADVVVLAAGAWSPKLVPELESVMWPVAQPVLHFRVLEPARFQPPGFVVWGADIALTGWYGFPALADGTLKIANHGPGRRLDPDAPRQVAPDQEARYREFLSRSIPETANARLLSARVCLYCDTWDGDFYLCGLPDREGLIVATGGSGHAFKFAPALGPLIADVVESKGNAYAHRFAWRQRGERTKEEARHLG